MSSDLARHIQNMAQIGAAVLTRWRADRDEYHFGMIDAFGRIGAKAQTAGSLIGNHKRFQTGLENRNSAGPQASNLLAINIQAQHPVPHFSKTRTGHKTHVAGAEQGDVHLRFPDKNRSMPDKDDTASTGPWTGRRPAAKGSRLI